MSHRVRVGIHFDAVVYSGNVRDYVMDAPIIPEALEFLIKHYQKPNLEIMMLSSRSFSFKGRTMMRQYIRNALEKWLTSGVPGRYESVGITIKPEITNYMLSDKTILDGLINTWLDNVIDAIEFPIICMKAIDIEIDDVSMFKSVLWNTPYLTEGL